MVLREEGNQLRKWNSQITEIINRYGYRNRSQIAKTKAVFSLFLSAIWVPQGKLWANNEDNHSSDVNFFFDLTNLVNVRTCFKSATSQSFLDVILTNRPRIDRRYYHRGQLFEFLGTQWQKVNCFLEVALALKQLNPIHKKGP